MNTLVLRASDCWHSNAAISLAQQLERRDVHTSTERVWSQLDAEQQAINDGQSALSVKKRLKIVAPVPAV